MYRRPKIGVSIYFSTLGNKDVFGNQVSLYPFYGLNIIRRKHFEFGYQMGVGASWVTKEFDPETNFGNVAIGSHLNIHYHADFLLTFSSDKGKAISTGISFAHISNANLSEPNVGLNWASIVCDFTFGVSKPVPVIHNAIDELTPFFTQEIMIAGGMKHTRTFESFQYPAVGLSYDFKRRTSYKFAWGIGADVFFDASTKPQMERLLKPYKSSDAWTSGLHITAEFVYNQISFILVQGVFVGLSDNLFNHSMYNRAMFRYKFSKHWMVNTSMKSFLYILDYPEIGIGYYW